MIRLKEQQLHMLMWMMAIASVLLFGILGLERNYHANDARLLKGLDDFSDGWICTYETSDMELLERYQRGGTSTEEIKTDVDEENYTIVDVVTFPAVLSLQEGTTVTMMRKVPEMKQDTAYVTLKLDNARIRVSVDENIIYLSSPKERMIPVYHVIPISPEHSNKMMTITIEEIEDTQLDIQKLQSGSYNQLWVTTLKQHSFSIAVGFILFVVGIIMLLVAFLVQNTWQQKRILLYSAIEGLILGVTSILDTNVIPLVSGWNYGVYVLKACTIFIAIALHLMLVRCFIYKKKVIGVIDTTILSVGIVYISVVVLQFFSLMHFDTIYIVGLALFGIVVVTFTVMLAITIFDYQRREGMPVFVAHVILILCMLAQLIMHFAGRQSQMEHLYIRIGCLIYMGYIWFFGLKRAFYVQPKKEELPIAENELRARIVERINPNLLFASFHTLQQLIKSGSSKSVKMIYYISVYFRDNMKALEAEGETISFAEELEHIIAYLQLQKTRNQNLDFAIECKVKEFLVPRHSLVPLVENAVKHGIANNNNSGNVAIRTYTRADGYAIQIIDDGAGFDTSIMRKKACTLSEKMALIERTCQARTEVISKAGRGTVITIVLPMLENDLMDDTI